MKKQVNNRQPQFVTQETKYDMIERNEAQYIARQTNKQDYIRKYHNLRNSVNKQLYLDNKNYNTQRYKGNKGNPNKQYKTVREDLGWKQNTPPPTRIIKDQKLITNTK